MRKLFLNVGCGNDKPKYKGIRVINIDIDPKYKPDIICDFYNFSFKDESFDTILNYRIAGELGPSFNDFIDEEIRILKWGGTLVYRRCPLKCCKGVPNNKDFTIFKGDTSYDYNVYAEIVGKKKRKVRGYIPND